MASAETGLGFLRVLFIEFPFLMRGFPKRDQVVVFACGIVAHFENQGVHSATHQSLPCQSAECSLKRIHTNIH